MRGLADVAVFVLIVWCIFTVFVVDAVFINGHGITAITLTEDETVDVDWLSHFDQIKGSYARVSTINVKVEWAEIEKLKENGWELINMNSNIITKEYIFQKVETEKEITQVSG